MLMLLVVHAHLVNILIVVSCLEIFILMLQQSSHPAVVIALGQSHTCVIMTGGGIKCWGYNGYGQLGNGGTSQYYYPANVYGGTNFSCFTSSVL